MPPISPEDMVTVDLTTVNGAISIANIGVTSTELVAAGFLGGPQGQSAYDIAVANGFTGTQSQWLATLVGPSSMLVSQPTKTSSFTAVANSFYPAIASGAAIVATLPTSQTGQQLIIKNTGTAVTAGATAYPINVTGTINGATNTISLVLAGQSTYLVADQTGGWNGAANDLRLSTLDARYASSGSTVSDATTTSKGIVQLAGDLGGTAASPTVPTKLDKDITLVDLRKQTGDMTTVLQNAINLSSTPGAFVRILLPQVVTIGAACVQAGNNNSSGRSSQLTIPNVSGLGSTPMSYVEFVGVGYGSGTPPTNSTTSDVPSSPAGTVIRSSGVNPLSGTTGSVIDTLAANGNFTNVNIITRDIIVRLDGNTTLTGWNMSSVCGFRAFGTLRVDTYVAPNTLITQPTNQTTGLIMPLINNNGGAVCDEAYVAGFYNGITIAEHTVVNSLGVFKAVNAIVVGRSYHAATINYASVEWSNNFIYCPPTSGGAPYTPLNITCIDIEEPAPSDTGWYQSVYHVNDANNNLHGNIGWVRVQSGNGQIHSLLINGAANVIFDELSANIPASAAQLNRTLSTTVNDTVEIGSWTFTNGTALLNMQVVVAANNFGVAKEYLLPIKYGQASSWTTVTPVVDSGIYTGNNYSLEMLIGGNILTLRLRRTAGTTAGNALVTFQQYGVTADQFTPTTATTTGTTAPTATYSPVASPGGSQNLLFNKGYGTQWGDANDAIHVDDNPTWLSGKQNVMTFDTYGAVSATGAWVWREVSSGAVKMVLDANTGVLTTNSPNFTGMPLVPTATAGTSTTQAASTAFVSSAVAAAITGTLNFKGSTDASTNPNYPSAKKGDVYIVSVAGEIGGASGVAVDVGDEYFATADNAGGTQAAVGTSWDVLEHNLVGALLSANNLSDLSNIATARTNLGLGTLATQNGTFSGASSGTNTGDQTITLTGGVTGSGTGTFAATVVTNANLTGPITSSGNATSITSQTGTGTTFAMSASPTFTGTVTLIAITQTGSTLMSKGQAINFGDTNDTLQVADNPTWLSGKQNVMTFGTYGAVSSTGAWAWVERSANKLLMSLDAKTGFFNVGGSALATSTLQSGGSFALNRTTVADLAYTVLATDSIIEYTSLTAARTITLPTAASITGRIYTIKDGAGAANSFNITVATTSSQTIDGATTLAITKNYGELILYSDGTNWKTLNAASNYTTGTATTDLGLILSNLGSRVAGTAYPITTSGAVALSGTFASTGSVRSASTSVTAAVTLTTSSTEYQICNPTAAITVTLPSTTTAGYRFTIKNISTFIVTVAGTIDGATNYSLASQYKYVTLISTTTSGTWYVVGGN